MGLQEYRRKRDFKKTREPQGGKSKGTDGIFVVQEHWASHHHFDFRLEAFGTLKSWAVPKGPSTQVGDKRLAVEVEDHPIGYAGFKGEIPEGEYGAGHVEIWDQGTWQPLNGVREGLKKGSLEFELKGKKLKGKWLLKRTQSQGKKNLWLLIKRHDEQEKKVLKEKTEKINLISPQLAVLSSEIPKGSDWIHEVKWDGYRTQVHIKGKSVQLLTRTGQNWTEKYEDLVPELKKLNVKDAILDGEVVVMKKKNESHFSSLQQALSEGKGSKLQFIAFDLLSMNGHDLKSYPLIERKDLLKKLLKTSKSKKILFSDHSVNGEKLYQEMCDKGLEGIISKNKNESYKQKRTDDWRKIKCTSRQELVIGGYTDPQGSREKLGALLLGTFEEGKLRYVGRVGTGFNKKRLNDIFAQLEELQQEESPFQIKSPPQSKSIHWVTPQLVAEVNFANWTNDGMIRQASFQGLREDKEAQIIIRETKKKISDFRITHPERILFDDGNVTKLDVANYYKSVSPWMLPHVAKRPLSFVRCPSKAGEKCFFQKHLDPSQLTELGESKIRTQKVNYIENEKGLLQLAQWGVLELHTWQTHVDHGEFPDQIVFDFDPDESVKWNEVVKAAFRMRSVLEDLSLESFVKTTGGKGVHVHVPIEPKYSWEDIKEFSKTMTVHLAQVFPKLYTTNILKKERKGKIFLDYLRNGYGATAVAPYSIRSKQRATTAVPISWEELSKLKSPDVFDVEKTLKRLSQQKKDPWAHYKKLKQKIRILDQRGKKKT